MSITRREFIIGSAALAAGTTVTAPFLLPKYHSDQRPKQSRVAILNAQHYSHQLDQILAAGLRLFPIDVGGKTVLLKPNLVDYIPGDAINTHPLLVLAAAESFRRLGGTARLLGKIVLANDPVAADATCAQLMGFDPGRIAHIREGSRFLGNASPALIDLVGETVNAPADPFQVVPDFRYLLATGVWL